MIPAGTYVLTRDQLAEQTACRGCGALIAFLELPSGKRMPVDVSTAKEEPCPACGLEVVAGDFERARRERCASCRSAGVVFRAMNHWATCPARDRFKKPRPPA